MNNALRTAALSLALPGVMAASLPAAAATWQPASTDQSMVYDKHERDYRDSRYYEGYGQRTYQQPYYSNDGYQTWRGNDGRYYCKKKNGTTGLIVGGAAGALLGRSIAGRGDNTLGTILGAAGGALLGRSVERNSSSRCR
ncbi:glycine zipper 2TM domain-containing protein [Novosphingobium sp. Gsoil 351]|uniref:glycine zipper 2TM domain-containing protein n=1 Tax=Novosphingobium sp. Gsoil 351 TaxID=2675225 RepID=UPI0012B5045C|nr:glycine zipper 2TM domain-containing protein [Novosphingobium sp. Gsoil 351]QGN54385.1 glycine zipper 2TM domain-containing protein [Novosphingobium sp. Gsoil 351]